jgi:hypothetical protein
MLQSMSITVDTGCQHVIHEICNSHTGGPQKEKMFDSHCILAGK